MLSLAINYIFDYIKIDKITLGVFENNKSAIACYRSVGFQPVILDKKETYSCMGETWSCLEMHLDRKLV